MPYEVVPGVQMWRRGELGLPARQVPQARKTEFIIHHSGGEELGRADFAAWWRQIFSYHTGRNGWADIGYNFGVVTDRRDPDQAHILEGRGWNGVGAHTVNHNTAGLGICYLRNGSPTPGIKRAIRFLHDDMAKAIKRPPALLVHKDVFPTACPGDLISWVVSGMHVPQPTTLKEASRMINGKAVEILATQSGDGYWIFAEDGGVFSYGDAEFFGSAGNLELQAPITNAAVHPSGEGYWLLGADGGVFAFGAAQFHGAPVA
jgi:hypothetical protein